MTLPLDWSQFLGTLTHQHIFSSGTEVGKVITFACEMKCHDQTAASHQLALYLCSAQNQRRALGFKDGRVYGATMVGNRLRLYTSTWEGEVIVSDSSLHM